MNQVIGGELLDLCRGVFDSGWYILGSEVKRFETLLADYVGSKWASGCGNGMDAIEIGLRILAIRPGDKVVTTPLTAFATSLAIHNAGGTPVFVDVDPSGQIDLDQVEALLVHDPAIRFMVPVHLFGMPLNLVRLRQLKKKYGLTIVEDCAQSIGATYGSVHVGSVGQIATISFYPTKNLGAFGDGGALWGNLRRLKKLADTYRDYGQSKKYIHTHLGLNSRLDELQAALLASLLQNHLDTYIQRRRAIADYYYTHITNPSISLLPVDRHAHPVWHLFPVLVTHNRRAFMEYCTSHDVQTGVHYPVLVPDQKASLSFTEHLVFEKLSQAINFSKHEVSLPIHPYMTDLEVEQVVSVVNGWSRT